MPEEVNLENAERDLATHEAEIREVQGPRLKKANVPGPHTVEQALQLKKMALERMARLEEVFRTPPTREAGVLDSRAMAFLAAEKRVDAVTTGAPGLRQELYQKAGDEKTWAVKVLDIVGHGDETTQKVLDDVRPGSGYQDRADDLAALHPQLVRYQDVLVEKQLMTQRRIAELGAMTKQLLAPGEGTSELTAAEKLENQAFSYFLEAWDAVIQPLRYVMDLDGDPTPLPSLYR